jgi:thymidylate kinase
MFTVALIGPDGAGKTTVGRRLQRELPIPATYLYMGVNAEASNCVLPTTRLIRAVKRLRGAAPDTAGPPDPLVRRPLEPATRVRRAGLALRNALRLANQLAEEWHRQVRAWIHIRRGRVVVFDRHFFADFHAYDIAGGDARPLGRRIHGLMLEHLYPRPDLVVYLDAAPEVLLARKGEGTIEALARRRRDYLELARLSGRFTTVDASRPLEDVTRDVARIILAFSGAGSGSAAAAAVGR